jgi:hypothetical protein
MFLFFKPPQSYLQVQLLDPDGFKKQYAVYEEEYAAKILLERRKKAKKRKKQPTEFKKQVETKLDLGMTEQEIVQVVDTEAMRLEVAGIVAEYQARLAAEIRERIAVEIQAQIATEAHARAEEELRAQTKIAQKRKLKTKKLKVLLLLASMDDE